MNRRHFIKGISAAIVITQGQSLFASDLASFGKKKLAMRFAILSDGHFAQPNTNYKEFYETAVSHVNGMHKQMKFDFAVMNGDIVHDNVQALPDAKAHLDKLDMKYYVTKGNHDIASPEVWEQNWNMPLNYDVVMGNHVLLFGNTSNEKGQYLEPDINWFTQKLEEHKNAKHIFIFLHIPPFKWTHNGVESPAWAALAKQHKNIKAVFHGHEHDQDNVKWEDGIPYLFDSHIGGNWGTKYKGYRIVELYKDGSMLTYIMNPTEKINELSC